MVSMTNEAFTDSPSAHAQMLALNVFRAIENGIAVARPATTGSVLIAPDGRILEQVQNADGRSVGAIGTRVGRAAFPARADALRSLRRLAGGGRGPRRCRSGRSPGQFSLFAMSTRILLMPSFIMASTMDSMQKTMSSSA